MSLDVTARLVVIVGGGAVAVRKAAGVLEAGATRVRCVSPDFHPGLPPAVERVAKRYEPRHLDGAGLVFAATDSAEVNDAVVRDARTRGVLVNRADSASEGDDAGGDFTVPAKWRKGPVLLTVSAGSPALAATIRDGLARRWDRRWTAMAEAMQVLRPMVVASSLPPKLRGDVLRDLVTEEAMEALDQSGIDGLKMWLERRHPGWLGLA